VFYKTVTLGACAPWRGVAQRLAIVTFAVLCASNISEAQTEAVLRGRVLDASGAVLRGAAIRVRNDSGFSQIVCTDLDGHYHLAAVPAGTYHVVAEAAGFRSEVIEALEVNVGRTLVRDFVLKVGAQTDSVVVRGEVPLIDRATATLGHVVTDELLRQLPLNGRHFADLGLLVPGSVSPSQNGFSSRPLRGLGALAFNTAGNREESVGFIVNGVSTNNLTFGSLIFEPALASIQEFKVDNSAFGAEHGHVSGAIVNMVTRSGGDVFTGDAFEFFRDDALDARNFFEFASSDPHPFRRHQFGGSLGGPIRRGRTFFFASYEGVRHRQSVDLNSLVLSDAERAAATDPVVRQLIPLIPRANVFDSSGTPRFVGSAPAVVDANRWTVDVSHSFGPNDRLKAFFGRQRSEAREPMAQGNSIPGFGTARRPLTGVLTIGETHAFSGTLLNETRFGRTVLRNRTAAASALNPAAFGIRNGVTESIGLPQMIVAGDLNFGGPSNSPQGRDDTLYVFADTLSRASGRHAMTLGGEYRHFVNENVAQGTGQFNFPSVDAFLAGTANAYTTTLGERRNVIDERALSFYVQDAIRIGSAVTLELGLRYEWHVTPTERNDEFVVFDAPRASLVRVGVDADRVYRQNNRNVEPRVGVAWTLSDDGNTVARAAYGRAVDQPGTSMVRDTAGNPPFGVPLSATGSVSLASALEATRVVALAPFTVDPEFRNASSHSWNVNLQRQLGPGMAATIGYLGSHGADLRISRNLNQPVNGVRPFPALSAFSPILPGIALGNITQVESSGYSNYNAGFVSINKRLSYGLQFDASYTFSKSLDTNSLNSSNFDVQDAYDIPNQYGPSDFDARHRFVLSAIYALPFTGRAVARGWQMAAVVQSQSGNPVNIVTGGSSLTGVPNSVRPDVTGPIRVIGSVEQWFDPSVFVAVNRFGNLPRNAIVGPAFHNTDLSLMKNLRPGGRSTIQVRADVFDVFNHVNFGPPGNIVGTPTFGKITRTRLPTGEAGSSRQVQLAVKVSF
jgi:hypothetical protein